MYFTRQLENQITKALSNHRITVVCGPRQSGKTTLLKHIFEECSSPKLFLDLDILENQDIFSSYREVVRFLEFNGYKQKNPFILFLDEFQTAPNISGILKNLHDHHPNLKIMATGSSSLSVLEQFKESLAGRKEILHLYPLTFQEFIQFKDLETAQKIKETSIKNIPITVRQQLIAYLKEFLIFGGYPEVALAVDPMEKKEVIRSIFDLFVKKDLIALLKMKNPQAAANILRYVAVNMGSVLNYSDLSTSQHIDINTLKRYLMILNETFILKSISPFFTNKNKEIVKAPKIYFVDAGVRNYFLKNFSLMDERPDAGFLAENFVLSQALKQNDFLTEIKFWRDKNGREIDFVFQRENKLMAYEIKWKKKINLKDVAHLRFFKRSYPQAGVYLVSLHKAKLRLDDIGERDFFEI